MFVELHDSLDSRNPTLLGSLILASICTYIYIYLFIYTHIYIYALSPQSGKLFEVKVGMLSDLS